MFGWGPSDPAGNIVARVLRTGDVAIRRTPVQGHEVVPVIETRSMLESELLSVERPIGRREIRLKTLGWFFRQNVDDAAEGVRTVKHGSRASNDFYS